VVHVAPDVVDGMPAAVVPKGTGTMAGT